MKKEKYILLGLVVLSLLFLFIGCGTDPTDENQFLEGEYIFAAYRLDDSVPFASIQTMSFQANNELQYDTIYSSQGDGDSGTIPYTLTGEGTLHIENWEGQVSPDCELIGLIDQEVMVNSYVAIGIGFRKGSELDNAILAGSYRYYSLSRDINDIEGIGSEIDLMLDGEGKGTYAILSITGGGSGTGDLTYDLTADGSATVTIAPETPGEKTLNGIASSDGTKILILDTDISDDDVCIGVAIKRSTDMIPADIEGSRYFMFQYAKSDGNIETDSVLITLEMSTYTYILDQTGLITVAGESGDGTRGIVSPEGSVIILMFVNTEDGTIPINDGEIDPGIDVIFRID